jgi:acyl-CoA reductase-like NAD-dependent aldehyde dehydrogenase
VHTRITGARVEFLGPGASLIPFSREAEAIAIANESEYGLAGAVWTGNLGRAHRVARTLQAGQVYINDYMPVGVEAPFGGYKSSGYGREKGLEAVREYTQVKAVAARYGN